MTRRPPRRSPNPPAGSPRAAALRLLGRRDYTREEITTRLVARGYDVDLARAAVVALVADGSIDDRRTARAHVRTAVEIKHRGRLRIMRELEARGIARDIARAAVDEIAPGEDARAIRRFLDRTRRSADPTPAERRRLFQQLLRRGFQADEIAKALKDTDQDE